MIILQLTAKMMQKKRNVFLVGLPSNIEQISKQRDTAKSKIKEHVAEHAHQHRFAHT